MATALARNVNDRDYAQLGEGAAENNRSISEELRILIAEYARKRRGAKLAVEMKAFRKKHPITLPPGMTSLDLLREERDSW